MQHEEESSLSTLKAPDAKFDATRREFDTAFHQQQDDMHTQSTTSESNGSSLASRPDDDVPKDVLDLESSSHKAEASMVTETTARPATNEHANQSNDFSADQDLGGSVSGSSAEEGTVEVATQAETEQGAVADNNRRERGRDEERNQTQAPDRCVHVHATLKFHIVHVAASVDASCGLCSIRLLCEKLYNKQTVGS